MQGTPHLINLVESSSRPSIVSFPLSVSVSPSLLLSVSLSLLSFIPWFSSPVSSSGRVKSTRHFAELGNNRSVPMAIGDAEGVLGAHSGRSSNLMDGERAAGSSAASEGERKGGELGSWPGCSEE